MLKKTLGKMTNEMLFSCMSCINIKKIKKAAIMFQNVISIPYTPPNRFQVIKDIIENIVVCKGRKLYTINIIETDSFPWEAEAFSYVDGGVIKIIIIKDYEEHFSGKRKIWTLIHEFSHIGLGHVFLSLNLTTKQRWYLDKEANKLARELLMPEILVKASIFDNEKINPLKIGCFSAMFGISCKAAKNTLAEYGIYGENLSKCPFFPETLECINLHDRNRCINLGAPLQACISKARENNFHQSLPVLFPKYAGHILTSSHG